MASDSIMHHLAELRPNAYGISELESDGKKGCEQLQAEVLRGILALHENTEYLQTYNLGSTTTVDEFKAVHPVTDYTHFKPWVEREASGEGAKSGKQILCAEKVVQFLLSSGTTSGRKLIPETVGSMSRVARLGQLTQTLIQRHFGPDSTDYSLRLVNCSAPQILSGGYPAVPIVTGLINLSLKYDLPRVLREQCSPPEVYTHTLHDEASYCHMLCALASYEKLTAIRTTFATTLVTAFTDLEKNWPSYLHDLRTGTVNVNRVSSPDVRTAVAQRIGVNPGLADRSESEFRKGFEGILPRVWPSVKFVECIFTGPMTGCVAPMRRFAGPDLPLVSMTYASSESIIGINVDLRDEPSTVRYTMLPREAFWEFMPVEEHNENEPDENGNGTETGGKRTKTDGKGAETVTETEAEKRHRSGTRTATGGNGNGRDTVSGEGRSTGGNQTKRNGSEVGVKTFGLHELELGRCYEVVLTNWAGLYRYRLEDVIKVEGFLHSLPQVSFQYRRGVLSIQGATEHMTEKDLTGAVMQTAAGLSSTGHRLVDYTTAIDDKNVPPRYTLFWEIAHLQGLAPQNPEEGLRVDCLAADLESELCRRNALYGNSVRKHELAALEVCIVRPGTFEELFRFRVKQQGLDAGQYKVPRCIKTEEMRGLFRTAVVQSSSKESNWLGGCASNDAEN